MTLDTNKTQKFVNDIWDQSIVPQLVDYIAIPAKSPAFDPDWEKNGHIQKAVDQIAAWCRDQPIEGLTVEEWFGRHWAEVEERLEAGESPGEVGNSPPA